MNRFKIESKVEDLKQIYKKGYITGSYALGLTEVNDIDIIIMDKDFSSDLIIEIFDEKSQYDTSVFGNRYSFKYMYEGIVVNIIVFDDETNFNKVKIATKLLNMYAIKHHRCDIGNKEIRVALFEYILNTLI